MCGHVIAAGFDVNGLAFISSNAVTIAQAALLVVDTRILLDAWLSVAALRVLVATERVVAVRALRLAALEPRWANETARLTAARLRDLAAEGGGAVRGTALVARAPGHAKGIVQ